MSRARNRKSALGENLQRPFIANGALASIDLNQAVLLQSRQRTRYDFWRRAYSRGYLLPRAIEMEEKAAPNFYKSATEFNEHRCFGH